MLATRRHGRTDGCWTCKLRRKKCDELRPTCGDCDSLEIACNYGPKPTWMDGGEQQRQKTASLKNEIKRNATYRREKANASSNVAHEVTTHQFNIISNMMASNNLLPTKIVDSSVPGNQAPTQVCSSATSHGSAPFSSLPNDHQHYHGLNGIQQSPAIEIDFIMKYLDFVFPSLFPFYRPSLFETGRSWLIVLLGRSKVAYHSAVSLTCYFFTMALTDAESGEEHSDCKQVRWEEVEQQTNQCFDSLKIHMSTLDLNLGGAPATKLERVEILLNVNQILIFEIALGRSAPWNSHLPPAFALFEEVMASSDISYQGQGQSNLASVLLEIGHPLWTRPGQNGHIWSPDQAGFRFCAGFLIFIDVVGSTVIQKAPRLLSYHSCVLATVDDGKYVVSDAEVRLSAIVGCRNWVVRSIAEISALDSWKQERIDANSLPVAELFERASGIASKLMNGIFEIQTEHTANSANHRAPFDTSPNPCASSKSTLVWALAAQLYLEVVLHGWQISNAAIRANVTQIIDLLPTVPPYQLRALAWPLCVAGCLALESEETSFTALFTNQGKVYTAGALVDARQIMEKVWQIRPVLDATTWNLASCFGILGSPVLLA
ncbi:fungal-specific transcription factor domain-containing protein [Lophiotrema nucula]|uniref:Fungal-specific transcription factor domain-containing protein n=1 Tax=Lophiotrema nucula TaxID=690887 RepID=A0A6A5YFB0_9PLEO|nr:fungal-specific transcription factor domain-containing protein [Lophiotrema nucula]